MKKVLWTGGSPGCVTTITLPGGQLSLKHGENTITDEQYDALVAAKIITKKEQNHGSR
jgi:hypothetical protein